MSIFTYAGEITIGLLVQAESVHDPDAIVADVERELAALVALDPVRSAAPR